VVPDVVADIAEEVGEDMTFRQRPILCPVAGSVCP
jgi:hypothetical protein